MHFVCSDVFVVALSVCYSCQNSIKLISNKIQITLASIDFALKLVAPQKKTLYSVG